MFLHLHILLSGVAVCCFCRSCQTTRGAPRLWSCRQGHTGTAAAGYFARLGRQAGSSVCHGGGCILRHLECCRRGSLSETGLLITSACLLSAVLGLKAVWFEGGEGDVTFAQASDICCCVMVGRWLLCCSVVCRVPDELRKHYLSDGEGGQYSTNLDRNRYGNDDQYLFTGEWCSQPTAALVWGSSKVHALVLNCAFLNHHHNAVRDASRHRHRQATQAACVPAMTSLGIKLRWYCCLLDSCTRCFRV